MIQRHAQGHTAIGWAQWACCSVEETQRCALSFAYAPQRLREGRAEAAEALAGSLITQMATGTQHSRGVAGGTLLPEPHGWTGWNTVLILHSGSFTVDDCASLFHVTQVCSAAGMQGVTVKFRNAFSLCFQSYCCHNTQVKAAWGMQAACCRGS